MSVWTRTSNLNVLANLDVQSVYKDGVFMWYELFPCDGFVLWVPSGDEYEYDDEGNLVLDENGNPILINHYYTWGGATVMPNYDFATNPNGYAAVPYDESMTVYGGVTPPTVTE